MNRLSINFAWTALNLAGRALLLSLCVTAIGCAVNPVTGENELSLVSVSQEIAIGEQQYGPSQQSQGGLYYLDPGLQSYVADVGMKLAKVSHQPDLPYEFVVINSAIPNAWALPGGKIAVNRGLLTELEDEAQLAAVLGHEIVHAAARHSAAQMTRDVVFGEDPTDQFFRLFGDSDGDRDVDGQDYGRFGLSFLKSEGMAGYDAAFDGDGDGDVDGQDYGRFGLRFLKTLPL